MKTIKNINWLLGLLACCTLAFTSCTKESSDATNDLSVDAQTIAVANPQTTGISGNNSDDDTVYVLHECKERDEKVAVAEANLSADIKTYLSTNYSGYTFVKAFKIVEQGDDNGNKGHIVIIYYNDKPVALRFNADGSFKKVLEQREKKDVRGKGWHLGGRFQSRSGLMQDTVALADIPVGITTFFRATYGTDTLTRAYKVHQGGYLLLSVNNGVYATAFSATGSFFKRIRLNAREGKAAAIEAAALPAAITNYLTTTYPGYVFNRAYTISANGAIKGYVVVIDANNTRYGLAFDANGNFEAAKVIR
ncbi:Putative beta-lactamase-inhibitor-like, PepSY-like [Cnuella takakiae]|uniref:Putative beta-lactamase-inhibitor-like, PepSY-like n=1 Tax=Cnuella takakiae TaxID=1302690 RepID=A0A1M5D6N9_9BACT|nr:PepSY-like domain-containing protein [Cnuella takakiae]OLY94088.1 hypothetical protein BUE76_20980 [Cnuella takakiae]SHF62666.1 Putative beta-lactamase-inhibitor-like, PepSY-like [Cnuella takakiae]